MTTTIQATLAAATVRLAAAGAPDAARDARALMADALGAAPAGLTPIVREALPEAAGHRFAAHVAERLRRRPVAQILGRRAFWGRDFIVTADVLDPRPETEALVALALAGPEPARLLDLGVGSGAILVTLLAEWPETRGVGTDLSPAALAVAADNAARHGVAERVELKCADWGTGLVGSFDLVVANPPYIPADAIAALDPEVRDWEPRLALTPGPCGLEGHSRIAADLDGLMAPGGCGLFEIGVGQGPEATALFHAAGFATQLYPDLDDRDRVIAARRPPGWR